MKEPEVRKADVSTELELPMYDAIAAGFPSQATVWPSDSTSTATLSRTPKALFTSCQGTGT